MSKLLKCLKCGKIFKAMGNENFCPFCGNAISQLGQRVQRIQEALADIVELIREDKLEAIEWVFPNLKTVYYLCAFLLKLREITSTNEAEPTHKTAKKKKQ